MGLTPSIHEKETRSQQTNNPENEGSDKENNTLPNIILRNASKIATRGRPKLSRHRNQQSQRSASQSLNGKRKH
ncbi:14058_t:CDS:2, partial [Gigaspora rosea]